MLNAIIVGGSYSADHIIKTFKKNNIPFVVVNGNKKVANYLSAQNDIDVYYGPTNKLSTYQDLAIMDFDLVVALEDDDVRNYIIVCLLKKFFNVKRAICTVSNPDNYDIFRMLGIEAPISNSYLLAERILNDSDIGEVTKRVTIENGEVTIIDISLRPNYRIVGKLLKEVKFPAPVSVCAINRRSNIFIPNGETRLLVDDRLIVSALTNDQKKVLKFIKKK